MTDLCSQGFKDIFSGFFKIPMVAFKLKKKVTQHLYDRQFAN